jgi:hypothetical protein
MQKGHVAVGGGAEGSNMVEYKAEKVNESKYIYKKMK